MKKNNSPTFFKKAVNILVFLFFVGCLAFVGLFLSIVIKENAVKEPSFPPEGIIVLGAQVKEDGTPSLQLTYRLEAALAIHRQYPNVPIVTCGAKGKDEPEAEAIIMKQWLIANGVKEEAIYCDTTSLNTRQNLHNAKMILASLSPPP
ncbi:MAG: YdcF family protein, partial [Clostridiales bacterium]|nr:YdcF family protein [Clostridiales bacterium]